MMFFTGDDLDALFADMADGDFTFDGVTVPGIFSEEATLQPTADGDTMATVVTITLEVRATDWPTVADGSAVTGLSRTFVVEGDPLPSGGNGATKIMALVEVVE